MNPLKSSGIIYPVNPIKASSYYFQMSMGKLTPSQRWAYSGLSTLQALARTMGYLVTGFMFIPPSMLMVMYQLEGTINMAYTSLMALNQPEAEEGKKAKGKALRSLSHFKDLVKELESQKERGFSMHPKMDQLRTLIVEHFGQRMGEEPGEEGAATRAMIFVTYRQAIDEIVDALNFDQPLIRATKFVGQGTDTQGNKGMSQKEQLEIIRKFKADEFNVLVATSIGEEGLDIGEVDLIVCYDAQKTPIRMVKLTKR
jgi:ATP-dependent DNA helicase MPH1